MDSFINRLVNYEPVVLSSFVPQGGGRVQRWESKCRGVLGIPLLEDKKRFLVFFLVSWFQKCVMCSNISLVHIARFPFHVFERYEIHIRDLIDFI